MSLMPTGTPCSGPIGRPELRKASASAACFRARSRPRKRQALTSGSDASMRARQASVTSVARQAPAAIWSRKATAPWNARPCMPNRLADLPVIDQLRQPEDDVGENIEGHHGHENHKDVRHAALENVDELDVRGRDSFQII